MIDRLASPWALWALAIIPIAVALLWRRRRAGVRFSELRLVEPLGSSVRTRLRWVPSALRVLALALLIVAIARPQRHAGQLPASSEGIAIQLVVDRSGSMAEPFVEDAGSRGASGEGAAPFTKLDAVKRLVRQFVLGDGKSMPGRPNDLLGLVTFARFADTACPLARSPEILVQLAEQTRVASGRAEDGTAIGDGLALAAARLRAVGSDEKPQAASSERASGDGVKTPATPQNAGGVVVRGRVIILLTDGQNNAGDVDPLQAAELARSWGQRVYTIGLEAAPPQHGGDPFENLRRSMGGVDEATLTRIAEMTGGKYFSASDAATLREVYATIDRIERAKFNSPETALYAELFPPLAIAAVLIVMLELLLSNTSLRRLP